MNEHIDILLLLDYAQGKIPDDSQRDPITDHLCYCEYCRQILKSHYYLIRNHDILLEKFFPEPISVFSDEKTAEPARQTEFQLSVSRFIQSISDKIQVLKRQGGFTGQEIKAEILWFLDEIKSFSNLEESLVPLKVENITLLGAGEIEKLKDQKLMYLSGNIKLRILPLQHFEIKDFTYRFTGRFFYISYEKDNFNELKDRKVNLTTDIGAPFIFTTTFKETHKSVSARFKIEFEDRLPVEDSTENKESYHEFFLSIE
jgi:hypothetical protein